MDEQPGQQAAQRYSQDGKWWWDGSKWIPVEQPKPESASAPAAGTARPSARFRRSGAGGPALAAIGIVLAFVIGFGVGRSGASSAAPVSSSPNAAPTATATATATATPTRAPTPLTLSGQGSKVVDFDLPKGSYKLAWQAQGHDNFIVDLEGTQSSNLVNEIPPNPSSGETFVRLGGGHYALNVKASTLSWTITFTPE